MEKVEEKRKEKKRISLNNKASKMTSRLPFCEKLKVIVDTTAGEFGMVWSKYRRTFLYKKSIVSSVP
jgi:hypothetical protein